MAAAKVKKVNCCATPSSGRFLASFAPSCLPSSGSFFIVGAPAGSNSNPISIGGGGGGDSISFSSSDLDFPPLSSSAGSYGGAGNNLFSRSAPTFIQELDPFASILKQLPSPPSSAEPVAEGSRTTNGWKRTKMEDKDGLHLKMDMPGLSKEDVKVTVDKEKNMLVIKGESAAATAANLLNEVMQVTDIVGGDVEERKYNKKIPIVPGLYKLDQIKAEMKNGVLKVFVPKLREEERTDVILVKVE